MWSEVKKEGSLVSFMACVEESIKEKDKKMFEKGLDSEVKLAIRHLDR